MNITIAVALITALSTLAGVVISGTITLLINRGQRKTQHVRDRRQIRRDAYVQLLNQVGLIEHELDKCWKTEIPAGADMASFTADANTAIWEVGSMLDVVDLEGPEDVGAAVSALFISLSAELAFISLKFDSVKGSGTLIRRDENKNYGRYHSERKEYKSRVIECAQQALSDDSY